MEDLKFLMKDQYLKYASYVILERAIPDIHDGLKPVQRRILQTLFNMHDGKLHKVANVAGQTMALHPHGDAAIIDALVNVANKGFFLRRQGNFGNLYTGDPAAAARYIETALQPLALEALFNPELTEFIPSYDGRNQEPVTLPSKLPVLLMHGAEGIAVGMSTRIFPHNFVELLEAQIAILNNEPITLYPDFPTGGRMDVSEYDKGRGRVKVRAQIEIVDPKTIVIREICYGTTTESLVKSIDDAAKRGKIKIDSIHDYTAEKVEIEVKLPRGQYAEKVVEALYAYTDCQVSLNSQVVVIKDNYPLETDVEEVLRYNTHSLQTILKRELELQREKLKAKIFDKTLEQIFIENRLYQLIEDVKTYELVHEVIAKSLIPFHPLLNSEPQHADRERLLSIPIRRISRFDIEKNQQEIKALNEALLLIEKELTRVKQYTIKYLKELIKVHGKERKRLTLIDEIAEIDKRAISTEVLKVGYDPEEGYVGTKVKGEILTCTNYDKLLLISVDGSYRVTNIPEKQYIHLNGTPLAYFGVADKKTEFSAVYKDKKSQICYAKRFVVKQFILDKEYSCIEEGASLEYLTAEQPEALVVQFVPKAKQKVGAITFDFKEVKVKGVSAKGIRIASRPVKKITTSKNKTKAAAPQLDLFEAKS